MKKLLLLTSLYYLTHFGITVAIAAPAIPIPTIITENHWYGPIKQGQSLWNIAKEIRPDNSVNLQQVLVALWQLNPQAFSQACNPNTLKIHVSLQIPELSAIAAISPAAALMAIQPQNQIRKQSSQHAMSEYCPLLKIPTLSVAPKTGVLVKPTTSPPTGKSKATVEKSTTEDSANLSWLELGEEVLQNWQTVILPENNSIMTISPKWKKPPDTLTKKILGLIPKPSDSYSLASSKLLQVLYEEGIYAEITLVNFNKDNELGNKALRLAEQEKMDLIFSMGSESAAFLHEFYNGGKISAVTCTNKDPVLLQQVADYDKGSGTNIAYTSLNVPINIQTNYLMDLMPGLKNLGILYDRNHTQVVVTEVIPTRNKLLEMKVKVINIEVTSAETAKAELLKNIPAAITLMQQNDPELRRSVFWVTSSTLVFANMATIAQVSGKVAVLGSIPNIVTSGEDSAVMAIGIDRRNNAHLASIYAVKILKGQAQAGELKVGVVTPPDIAISFRAAQKVGLDIPFQLFESASFIYGYVGNSARSFGHDVISPK